MKPSVVHVWMASSVSGRLLKVWTLALGSWRVFLKIHTGDLMVLYVPWITIPRQVDVIWTTTQGRDRLALPIIYNFFFKCPVYFRAIGLLIFGCPIYFRAFKQRFSIYMIYLCILLFLNLLAFGCNLLGCVLLSLQGLGKIFVVWFLCPSKDFEDFYWGIPFVHLGTLRIFSEVFSSSI